MNTLRQIGVSDVCYATRATVLCQGPLRMHRQFGIEGHPKVWGAGSDFEPGRMATFAGSAFGFLHPSFTSQVGQETITGRKRGRDWMNQDWLLDSLLSHFCIFLVAAKCSFVLALGISRL